MLAKNVNDDAGIQNARGALRFFASKLAPKRGRKKNADDHSIIGVFHEAAKASRTIENRRAPRQPHTKTADCHALPGGVHHVLFQQQRNAR
ncbi:hypothetical protein FJ692_11975 [Pseudomonas fluorescens]|nr:hypothetical protein FJ692_11975 [Pseudomonas fluorescens]